MRSPYRYQAGTSSCDRGSRWSVRAQYVFFDRNQQIILLTALYGRKSTTEASGPLVIMAQMGSFIPAQEAKIGLVDRIFTHQGQR